jgi:hypothetical protein
MAKLLIPRRSEERGERKKQLDFKRVENYIKNPRGTLVLEDSPLEELPLGLTQVEGDLTLINTKIKTLPDNLKIAGSLYLDNSPILYLPSNLKVNGSAAVYNAKYLTHLGENITVPLLTIIGAKNLKTLPQSLKVETSIFVGGSKNFSIPENLQVERLIVAQSIISKIPNSLQVSELNLMESTIKSGKLPENLTLKTLNLYRVEGLKRLPSGLTVRGEVRLDDSEVEEIPPGTKIGKLGLSGDSPLLKKIGEKDKAAAIKKKHPGIEIVRIY